MSQTLPDSNDSLEPEPAVMGSQMPRPFLGDILVNTTVIKLAIEALLPAFENLAKSTATKIDDAFVAIIKAFLKTELAQEWLMEKVNEENGDMPPGAMAIHNMPDNVKAALAKALPKQYRGSFLGGGLGTKFQEILLPILLELLRRAILPIK